MTVDADVVVVGAGVAGLVTVRRIQAAGHSVVVVEARDRVGGRTLNDEVDGITVEVGGQWVGPGQDRINALIAELGLVTHPTYDNGASVFELGGTRKVSKGDNPPLNPLALAELLRAQRQVGKVARHHPARRLPWNAPDAARLDEQTFASWIRRTVKTHDARAFYEIVCQAVFATEPENLSSAPAHAVLPGVGQGLERLIGTTGGAQQDRVVGGTVLVCEQLAQALGDAVHLAEPVRRIDHGDDGVTVHTDAATYRAHRAVVAIPPTLAGRIAYGPALPAERDLLTQRLPHGYVIKAMLSYERPFWRDADLSGQAAVRCRPRGRHVRQLPAPRRQGHPPRLLRGPSRGRSGAGAAHRPPRAFVDCAARYSLVARPRTPPATSSGTGPPRSGHAGATGPPSAGRLDAVRGSPRACPSAPSMGGHRDCHRAGQDLDGAVESGRARRPRSARRGS